MLGTKFCAHMNETLIVSAFVVIPVADSERRNLCIELRQAFQKVLSKKFGSEAVSKVIVEDNVLGACVGVDEEDFDDPPMSFNRSVPPD